MNIFEFRDGLIQDYAHYVKSFIQIREPRIRKHIEQELDDGVLWPDPLIQLNPSFEPAEWIHELVREGILHKECARIFRTEKAETKGEGRQLRLHKHQAEAIRVARSGRNYVLTTGTGSGKSLAYIIPIVDHVLRSGSGRGIQAIVVYPMNALANSQRGELEKFLCHGYPDGKGPVTFERYTGQESDEDRNRIMANPPDILLTNYVMLELILTRPHERNLVKAAKGLRFLVLDELHTYRGRQGADVALLVRRVRDLLDAHQIQYVGTSATLAGSGTYDEQREEVAKVASQIFGSQVDPKDVIGETLSRTTKPIDISDPSFVGELAEHITDPGRKAPLKYQEFIIDPLSIWIEGAFGIRSEPGNHRLIRMEPRSISGENGAAGDDVSNEGMDVPQGSDMAEITPDEQAHRRRLLDMARQAEALKGDDDRKLQQAAEIVRSLVEEGHQPILFCRFIPTADYVARTLREKLPNDVEVSAITGILPPVEREDRVNQLAQAQKHVLVSTDCLSEGINLQDDFDAVMHYDLSWNPTRHEQREGRVDRFGQREEKVKTITYYGIDNQIDGIVLDVLLRKHQEVRKNWGMSVPVPPDSEQLIEAIFEGLLLREQASTRGVDQYLPGFEELLRPQKEEYSRRIDASADRERRSRTMFAQERIKVDEVSRELEEARSATGAGVDVERFVREAFRAHGGFVSHEKGVFTYDPAETPGSLRDTIGWQSVFSVRFDAAGGTGKHIHVLYLNRTHPVVGGLAAYVMDTALDPLSQSIARRCGVVITGQVERRTTVLLMRLRYHIVTRSSDAEESRLLAEDCQLLAFQGSPQNAQWLDSEHAEALMQAAPEANIEPDRATHALNLILEGFDSIRPHLNEVAEARGQALLEAHRRVRTASRVKGVRYDIQPILPPDILGVYVYLPKVS